MKTRLNAMQIVVVIIATAGGMLIIPSDQSHAAVVCPTTSTADADGDGLTDQQECAGITLLDNVTQVATCALNVTPDQRVNCLDPNSKDLFFILAKATNSLIDVYLPNLDPLGILRKTLSQQGLGITVHAITDVQAPNRQITATQMAIRMAENLDTSDVTTGSCSQGTPNGPDRCAVFTQRIVNLITSTCAGKACILSPGGTSTIAGVIAVFIQNTISHEASHSLSLTSKYDSRFGGNHYKTGTNTVMDQSVYYVSKTSDVTFYLPGVYASIDPSTFLLR